MYVVFEQAPDISRLTSDASVALQQVLAKLMPLESSVKISSGKINLADPAHRGRFYLLREGILSCRRQVREICVLEPGDLIGLDEILGTAGPDYYGEFAVLADTYEIGAIRRLLASDIEALANWQTYLGGHFAVLQTLISSLIREDADSTPTVKMFQPGDQIIREGEQAGEVYTLVSGSADVFVDGVNVGKIEADQIFGMLAAITMTKRTATVLAKDSCMVLALPRERFVELIAARPSTVLKLIEDMAKMIVTLNERVVGFEKARL